MGKIIRVGITHGDINGIGYEVIVKALSGEGVTEIMTPVVFGYKKLFDKARKLSGVELDTFKSVDSAAGIEDGVINIVEISSDVPQVTPGISDAKSGKLAVHSLEKGVEALKEGYIDVLVTAPISKNAVQSDEFHFPGHTEYLDDRIGDGTGATMILFDSRLKVALVTTHLPVSEISGNITQQKIEKTIAAMDLILRRDFGIERPKLAILSLNPHCGDNGLLGKEEENVIIPAISASVEKGILAFGPFAADGYFASAQYRQFDATIAMYHDQGLAPFKAIADGGVNFTGGLKFVRTSPDHGTGFDIAWKGEADPRSMREAIYSAIDIYRSRQRYLEASRNPLRKAKVEKGGADKTVDLSKEESL